MNPDTPELTPAAGERGEKKKPPPPRRGRRGRNPWPVRIAVLLILAVGVVLAPRLFRRPPLDVDVVKVTRGTVSDEISSESAGEVLPAQSATVRAELSARILSVRHQVGDRVKKGEVIVILDSRDLDAKLRQARATLDAQRASVVEADARAQATARDAERFGRLAERGAETQQTADNSAAQAREAAAAAQAAHAQLAQAEAALQSAQVARTHADLTAPFDGVLADIPVDPGDEPQPGAVVFELVDDSHLYVEAPIDEADIERVKVGQPAVLRLDALPKQPIEGVVTRLDPTVRKDEKGARTLRIDVDVANLPDARAKGLRAGMSANVDVRVAEKQGVLNLPTNVIVGRGTKRTVYLVDQGVARERPVQVGLSSWEKTEITSGLSEGDRVVSTLNVKGLADGARVSVRGEATP